MGDKFSVKLELVASDTHGVWYRLARVRALLLSEFGAKYGKGHWEAGVPGRRFTRDTLEDLQKALTHVVADPMIYAPFFKKGQSSRGMAIVRGRVFGKFDRFDVSVNFHGNDRIAVERDAHAMQAALERETFSVTRGELEVYSSDDGESARGSTRWIRRALGFLGQHVAAIVVGVVSTVVGAALVVWFGIGITPP